MDLKTFKNELFEVAVKLENGEILFDVEKVAISLGITDNKNGKQYVRWKRVNSYLPSNSPEVAKGDFIIEPLAYKLAFKASNEVAEKFQDWLAMEVIPTIRKTGGYIEEDKELEFIDKYFPTFSDDLKMNMVKELTLSNKALQVKASKWDKFLDTSGTYNFTEVAKLISTYATEDIGEQFKISNQGLTKFLREEGILSKMKSGNQYNNLPNQDYEKYFDVVSVEVKNGGFNKPQARVKASGVEFIYGKLIEEYFVN